MIRLEAIDGRNVREILNLRVREDQERFVAPNDQSLIEAYLALAHHGRAFPFAICDGAQPVGFCMIGYGADDAWEDAPAIAAGNYNIWRFMVDRRWQGKGCGRAALRLALDFVADAPCGPAECCWLSYAPENAAARALYASFGFAETGEWDGDEVIAALPWSSLREKSPDREDYSLRDEEALSLRRAGPEDAADAAALEARLWPDHDPAELADEMESLLSERESAVFLCVSRGRPVGFALCQLRHDYVEGTSTSPVGYLEGIYVDSPFRRRGAARMLLAACEAWAAEQGCTEFASDCEWTNEESRRFHRAVGFREAGRIVAFTKTL